MLIPFLIYTLYIIACSSFQLHLQSWVVGMKTVQPTRPKIFTALTFMEKYAKPNLNQDSDLYNNLYYNSNLDIFWAVLRAKELKFRRDQSLSTAGFSRH